MADTIGLTKDENMIVEDAFARANNELVKVDFEALAREVLNESRVSLMMQFRFLDAALWRMEYQSVEMESPLATDGRKIAMCPGLVLARFQEDPIELTRDYLHLILHCIFRHPFDREHLSVAAFSLASDIIVESVAMEMCDKRFVSVFDEQRKQVLDQLEQMLGAPLTPMKLYRAFAQADAGAAQAREMGLNPAFMWDIRMLFARDNHEGWANAHHEDGPNKADDNDSVRRSQLGKDLDTKEREDQDKEKNNSSACQMIDEDNDDSEKRQEMPNENEDETQAQKERDTQDSTESDASQNDQSSSTDASSLSEEAEQSQPQSLENQDDNQESGVEDAQTQGEAEDDEGSEDDAFEELDEEELRQALQDWREISMQMEMDLQAFKQGKGSKELMANLEIANVKPTDYREFLRRFSMLGEDMMINDDEFDYIYYTYGIDHYGNMPLVEPLEYKESNRVREFVIALDTSGSCSGPLIKNFVARTYDILRETEGFGDEVNVHIIQCDNKVQTDLKITCIEDLQRQMQTFQVYGFGGTDFRPVFEYVDKLVAAKEFQNLRGLIYFTDGMGVYPEKPPVYETAFVFIDNGFEIGRVPPWAMKVVLDEDRIMSL